MKTPHDAYQLAAKIDGIIDPVLRDEPVDDMNWANWELFCRTVRTSLDLIETACRAEHEHATRSGPKP